MQSESNKKELLSNENSYVLNITWTIIDLLLVFGGNPFKKSVSRFNRLYKLHSPLLMDSWNRPRWLIIFSDNRCWSNCDQIVQPRPKKSVNIIWVAVGRRAVWKKNQRNKEIFKNEILYFLLPLTFFLELK